MSETAWALMSFLLVCLLMVSPCICANYSSKVEEILERLFEQNDYNGKIRPRTNMDETTVVSIGFYIQSLSSISEIRMEYMLDVYFRQSWNDPRLRYNDTTEVINTGPKYVDKLWLPDPYFVNSKEETFHTVTLPNVLVRLHPNGDVFYSQRLSLIVACNMVLHNFPMDDQICDLQTMSFSYTTKAITLRWLDEGSLSVNENNELPEFSLVKTSQGDCSQTYITGTYSCLVAKFYLSRRLEYYLVQTYLPTILIVVLSWVNFWIDPRATPARVSLGLLCVLTITTQSSGVQAKLPRVSYIKSMDVWLNICLVFVFGALLEYALVNVQARRQDNNTKRYKEHDGKATDKENGDVVVAMEHGEEKSRCSKMWLEADRMDLVSRFAFPFAFAAFNCVYWSYYQTRSTFGEGNGEM